MAASRSVIKPIVVLIDWTTWSFVMDQTGKIMIFYSFTEAKEYAEKNLQKMFWTYSCPPPSSLAFLPNP